MIEDAWRRGSLDYILGVPLNQNPYGPGQHALAWEEGWLTTENGVEYSEKIWKNLLEE